MLRIFNTLSGEKEKFEPLVPGHVGMYACGPTVYSDVHIGNCRTFTSFDIIYRYLLHCGYRVRYVRNITDVGHLLDDEEDRMAKGARLMKLEPMEVAQRYTVGMHEMMRLLNNLPPSIEPRASGHIPEQIELVETILKNGLAYERNGSVYFNVRKFAAERPGVYGSVSGRVLDDLFSETRDLKNQDEKDDPADFALWMKARPQDIMVWKSPWSVGFPGWHLECSAMSTKYLGKTFDIHGGGNDLKFPHHENEVAQNFGGCDCHPARFWLHTNMLLLNGRKMSKSEGNYVEPKELFAGTGNIIPKPFSPMVVRYFFLQAHYRSPLDITLHGLESAEKGYAKLMETHKLLQNLTPVGAEKGEADAEVLALISEAFAGMDDDFNTAVAMAALSELGGYVNKLTNKQMPADALSGEVLEKLKTTFNDLIFNVFGLLDETTSGQNAEAVNGLMNLVLDIRATARANKDWPTSDKIRDGLAALEITVKDGKEGSSWSQL